MELKFHINLCADEAFGCMPAGKNYTSGASVIVA
jgi:hypothetical protein